jgi:hypothetical protein
VNEEHRAIYKNRRMKNTRSAIAEGRRKEGRKQGMTGEEGRRAII